MLHVVNRLLTIVAKYHLHVKKSCGAGIAYGALKRMRSMTASALPAIFAGTKGRSLTASAHGVNVNVND